MTTRLSIRQFENADAHKVWHYRRLPDVNAWMTGLDADLDELRARLGNSDRAASTLVVEHKGELVGDLYFGQGDAWAQTEIAEQAKGRVAEIGWAFDPAYQGLGLASEAAEWLVALCFDTLALHRVTAVCFADNEPSWRLMERIGMRRETHAVEESLHRNGQWLDSYTYAMLAREWKERSAR